MSKVALLIPHYNNPFGLVKSIRSINEDEQCDIFVIDDGSNIKYDETEIRSVFKGIGDVKFYYFQSNRGIEFALNFGIEKIVASNKYLFIARLDCGDTNVGNRFRSQSRFLEQNPNIHLVGSWAVAVDCDGNELFKFRPPLAHQTIAKRMYFNNMFLHPTVMFTISSLKIIGFYPTRYKAVEDYAFFFKFIRKFETANLSEILVKFEINPHGISIKQRNLQVVNRMRIIMEYFHFGYFPVMGLIRNAILFLLPTNVISHIKSLLSS